MAAASGVSVPKVPDGLAAPLIESDGKEDQCSKPIGKSKGDATGGKVDFEKVRRFSCLLNVDVSVVIFCRVRSELGCVQREKEPYTCACVPICLHG